MTTPSPSDQTPRTEAEEAYWRAIAAARAEGYAQARAEGLDVAAERVRAAVAGGILSPVAASVVLAILETDGDDARDRAILSETER